MGKKKENRNLKDKKKRVVRRGHFLVDLKGKIEKKNRNLRQKKTMVRRGQFLVSCYPVPLLATSQHL